MCVPFFSFEMIAGIPCLVSFVSQDLYLLQKNIKICYSIFHTIRKYHTFNSAKQIILLYTSYDRDHKRFACHYHKILQSTYLQW